ncbi:MAG: RnfABCDGE type electron transport complex subunit B, partial [Chitinivibrionales bacterium]
MEIFLPVIIVGSTGLILGTALSIASRILFVYVDPKVEKIESILPSANCGACGYAGCSAFAKAVINGDAEPSGCIPGGEKVMNEICRILGTEAEEYEPVMAVVHCKGGNKEAKQIAEYRGIESCKATVITGNGDKECKYGCLGLGDCVRACPFNALKINSNGIAVVDPDKCTGCGKCVAECPRNIITLIPRVHKVFLACSNHSKGGGVKKSCSVGCTACTLCVKATPSGAIEMKDNLPTLDYSREENFLAALHKCPQNCFTDLVKFRPKVNIDTKCTGCGKCIE